MSERASAARALRPVLALGLAALVAGAVRAADCFAPLAQNDKWACTAKLSTGAFAAFCLNATASSGEGAARTFGMVVSGPFPRTCTCGAKGKGPDARHNAANTYLCFDASTDTAESGTIARKRLVGQLYNVRQNVRSAFTCQPDPACVVPSR
jgi:hypothetical protein